MEQDEKKCPYCGETIKTTAKKCRYCGEWVDTPQNSNAFSNSVVETKKFVAYNENKMQDHSVKRITRKGDYIIIELYKGRVFKSNYYSLTGTYSINDEKKYYFEFKNESGDTLYLFDSDIDGFGVEKTEVMNFLCTIPGIRRSEEDFKVAAMDSVYSEFSGIGTFLSVLKYVVIVVVIIIIMAEC